MAFNIIITINNSKNINRISHMIAELLENATGERAVLRIHNRHQMLEKRKEEQLAIQKKLQE